MSKIKGKKKILKAGKERSLSTYLSPIDIPVSISISIYLSICPSIYLSYREVPKRLAASCSPETLEVGRK